MEELYHECLRELSGVDSEFMAGPVNGCKSFVVHACLMLYIGSNGFGSAYIP
jgi:hypothetical protein